MSTQPDKTLGQIAAEKLKPCPFCGQTDSPLEIGNPYEENFSFRCMECHARTGRYRTRNEAKDAWNSRIDSVAQAQPVQSLEEIAREAASEVDDLCDCYCQSSVTEKEPIILRACQAAVRANRE